MKAKEFIVALDSYIEERKKNRQFGIRDLFWTNIHDSHSLHHRINHVDYLKRKIQKLYEKGITPEKFDERTVKIVKNIYEIIQENTKSHSKLRQILLKQGNQFIDEVFVKVQDEKVQNEILKLGLMHSKNQIVFPIEQYLEQTTFQAFPTSWGALTTLANNFIYPKHRETERNSLLALKRKFLNAASETDYLEVKKDIGALIQNNPQNQTLCKMLRDIDAKINGEIIKHPANSHMTVEEKSQPTSDDATSYFQRKCSESLIYHLIGHGISSTGLFERQDGQLGTMGKIAGLSLNPIKVGIVVSTLVSTYERMQFSEQDAVVTGGFLHRDIEEIAQLFTQKLMSRFQHQLNQLYYTQNYTKGVDALIDQMIKNALKNFAAEKIDPTQYSNVTEIFSEKLVRGVNKTGFRLPFLGTIFSPGHLWHKHDKNEFLSTKGWNSYGILQKPGYAYRDDNGELKFYAPKGKDAAKYGYMFVNKDEIKANKKILGESVEVDAQTRAYYENLSKQLQSDSKPKSQDNSEKPKTTFNPVNNLAKQILSLYSGFKTDKTYTLESLKNMEKIINKIETQIKQFQLGENEVCINPDKPEMKNKLKDMLLNLKEKHAQKVAEISPKPTVMISSSRGAELLTKNFAKNIPKIPIATRSGV
jgi:hypothetical protein